jgi:hypothetical protein
MAGRWLEYLPAHLLLQAPLKSAFFHHAPTLDGKSSSANKAGEF